MLFKMEYIVHVYPIASLNETKYSKQKDMVTTAVYSLYTYIIIIYMYYLALSRQMMHNGFDVK